MAYFPTKVLDNQIKALPTVSTASGSVANFTTDMQENLVSCVCQLPYRASGYNSITITHNSINLWNEQWELGTYDSSGQPAPSNTIIRSKTRIACKPNTTYYIKGGANNDNSIKYFYDINDNYLSNYGGTGSGVFTTPNNCAYMRFRMSSDYGTTYLNDISINFPITETTYSPFNGLYTEFPSVVYGGTFESISGTLTSTNESDGTEKAIPDIIRCNGGQIITLDNETNNIYNDCGNTEVNYLLSVGKAIS